MIRSTLLVTLLGLALLVGLAGSGLAAGRVALGTSCAIGLVLLSAHRRRSLVAVR
jgi:hypothetical protein